MPRQLGVSPERATGQGGIMGHGVHAVQHEVKHRLEHEHGGGSGHERSITLDSQNKKIALVIAILAMFLAFSETLGKSAQTNAISHTVEASNLWAFFQAKSIRRTTVLTAAEEMTAGLPAASSDAVKASMTKQIDNWQKTAARYRSEPDVREGTVELAERAKEAEARRDTAMARYHHYEVASAAFQIAIVLASSTVITGVLLLTYLAGGLGVIGLIFLAIGLLAPHAVHLF
jgi:hypothetical protein